MSYQEINGVLVQNESADQNDAGVHADVEEEPDLPVGVSIKGLRKVFSVSIICPV